MNVADIKKILKPIILKEIANADFGTPRKSDNETARAEFEKVVGARVEENTRNGKMIVNDGHDGELIDLEIIPTRAGNSTFDIIAIFNQSDRFVAKNYTKEDVIKFLKDEVKPALAGDRKSYTKVSREKSINSTKENPEEKKNDDSSHRKEIKKITPQVDIAKKNDAPAEVKQSTKSITTNSAPLGGKFVDEIDRVIDRVINQKTQPCKADEKNKSPGKLTVKLGDTPAIKK